MKKSPLVRHKGLAKVSPKQAAKDAVWRAITCQKAEFLGYICQWCGKTLVAYCGYTYDGHHIIRRSSGKRIDTYENCYCAHRTCHQFLHDHNIDVRKFPNLHACDEDTKKKWIAFSGNAVVL